MIGKTKSKKFTIIMSVYNVEKYIEKAIDSIINQNIGFEKNVQLILVNDGSTDNSDVICKKYAEKYKNNIIYLEKPNGGLASAKNFALDNAHIEGEYINFFDPDDILPSNVLKEVYKFFQKNHLFIDMVAIPLYFFEAKEGLHGKYTFMGNRNRIINLNEEYYNFVLSSASMFYKAKLFEDVRFDESLTCSEDTKVNIYFYLNNKKLGYVTARGVKYWYRQRNEQNSIVDKSKDDKNNYYGPINIYNTYSEYIEENDFLKELFLYELRSRIRNINVEIFDNKEEYQFVMDKYKEIVSKISTDFIINKSRYCNTRALMAYFLSLKGQKYYDEVIKREKSPINDITIRNVKFSKNNMYIDVTFCSFYNKETNQIIIYDVKNKQFIKPYEEKILNSPYDLKYGENIVDKTHVAKFKINLDKLTQYIFVMCLEDKYFKLGKVFISNMTKFALNDENIYCFYKNRKIRFKNYSLIVSKFTNIRINYLKKLYEQYKYIKEKYKVNTLPRIFAKRKKKYILINDRINVAGDNGEALFRYICETNYKNMKKNTYFVISKKSSDYKKLKKIGNVVSSGSLKHLLLFLNAKYIYSSHNTRNFYMPFDFKMFKFYSNLLNYKFIWLQHGITKDDISEFANKYRNLNNFVICGSIGEEKEFLKEKYLFEKEEIKLTGFSRYDLLENKTKNIITIMPTWRTYLTGKMTDYGYNEAIDGFSESEYYLNYKFLLTNEKLIKFLEENNYILKFALHPGMMSYIDEFKKFENNNIIILSSDSLNYNKLFKESKLIITDYSSAVFDFAYLKKPIIYFQFDKVLFFDKHYKKGYFDYETDGFGPVIEDRYDLIDKILEMAKNNFNNDKKYINRVEKTFKYFDKNNCKRILDETYMD